GRAEPALGDGRGEALRAARRWRWRRLRWWRGRRGAAPARPGGPRPGRWGRNRRRRAPLWPGARRPRGEVGGGPGTGGKDKASDRRRAPKKKVSILNQDRIDWVDYKDVNLLRRFMSERAKIRARRVTGNNAQQQREVARAIRVAREMALLPYSVRQVTQRSRSGRRDRGDRADLSAPMPTPDAPPPVAGDADALPEGVTVDAAEETG